VAAQQIFLENRRADEGTTSGFEGWFGRPPPQVQVQPIGCRAIAIIPRELRTKKDGERTRECIMMGYDAATKDGYVLFDQVTRSFIVHFIPNEFPLRTTDDSEKGIKLRPRILESSDDLKVPASNQELPVEEVGVDVGNADQKEQSHSSEFSSEDEEDDSQVPEVLSSDKEEEIPSDNSMEESKVQNDCTMEDEDNPDSSHSF
jgi:hypothetical protein